MPRNCCKYFTVSLVPIAALTLAILFACAIVALPVLYVELATRTKYGVVIDAGSSHTDLYIYSWEVPKLASEFTTGKLEQEYNCSSPRFLGNYTMDPENAGEAFQACVDDSHREKIIPHSEWKHTEIYLGATAGMRLVNISNHTASEAIMKAAREALQGSEYSFGSAQIIEEKEEAASGWVTTNYVENDQKFPSEENTVGSLDLGGASVEIAFIAPNDSYSEEYKAEEKLFGTEYAVYARSYLCYGHNEAQRRFLAHLVNTQQNQTRYQNPCYLTGSNSTFNHDDIFNSPCVDGVTAMEVFGYAIPSPDWLEATNQNYTFFGTSDISECNTTIQEVFNFTACNISTTCIGHKYFPPPVGGRNFVGFSGFDYVARFYNQSDKELDSLDMFQSNVTSYCKQNYSSGENVSQCYNGVYVLHMLQNGFGFTQLNSNWTVKFVDTVTDITVGWAMGYLMNKTNTISIEPNYTERPYTTVDLVVGVIILSILCLVFVIFFFLTFYACRKVIKTRSGYTDIA